MYIETRGGGYAVRYAIADVPPSWRPGGELDAETRRAGPDHLRSGRADPAASGRHRRTGRAVLAGPSAAAYVWAFELDAGPRHRGHGGAGKSASRAKLNYERRRRTSIRAMRPTLLLLKEVGLEREELERERGGASLQRSGPGDRRGTTAGTTLCTKPPLPVEDWNAQISL